MTSPRFSAIKSPSASGFVLIVPVGGQKVKGVSPGSLEVLLRSREEEPARTADRTTVAASFRHDFNA